MRCVFLALLLAPGLACAAAPTPEQVRAAWQPSEAHLLDRHGVALESVRVDMRTRRASWVALADMSPALGAAVLQAEDSRFMEHGGIDLRAAGQAAWDNLFRERPRGASTITMQLAGLLDSELRASNKGRNWRQKFDQALAAREIEAGWSKQQILEAYLNLAGFRGELQGIGAASRALFGKAPSGLDVAESSILAALLRAPSAAPRVVAQRACRLALELKAGTGCPAIEWRAAVALARPAGQPKPVAPLAWRKLLGRAGASVRTTLDAGVQGAAVDALRRHVRELADRNVGDGAVIVIDNASGELLAWVANTGHGEVDGVLAPRQAGSTLKPFLYALAIERRLLTAASLLDDSPVDIAAGSGSYVPQNYDRSFKGYASVRTSLASSLNVPAVRTLLMTGVERFHARLQQLGITTLTEDADFYGPSLALGSGDVTLLELANAYRTLANGGRHGTVTLRPREATTLTPVVDQASAFVVGDILSDRGARSPAFGLRNDLATPYWSAVKTGTSKDMRDNWCIGYSTRFTVGVWVGNFNGQPMWDVSGVSGAAPVWRDLMDYLHRDAPGARRAAPAGLVRRKVAYAPAHEPAREEWFLSGTETALVEAVPAGQRTPKIVYPIDGSILARDPDIPDAVERVVFQAQGVHGHRWRLDGQDAGAASAPVAWQPALGGHWLELVDAAGKAVSTSRFEVRGN
ncbi:penicillin-binding protein 1C [Telluria aromaticivorans]|uniref:peptidoglycan glycosyltransferase n=1 Tax=Telluria aromaticivorans TaxID=2725995 RepID=A0A7Y2NXG0_9BURK|nr:penicillin-binding protein 1C [Telluria aromaticivorans]NNG21687.1 penicillin-binding protein 1C [Telluria aromaticivorans]